jgi:protein MpaA
MRRLSGPLFLLIALWLLALGATTLVVPGPAQADVGTADRAGSVARAAFESRVIGYTVKDRPIRAWRLGDPTSPVKAVFIASMHGNEAQPAKILLNLRDGAPVTGADIWVVPYMNRDGFVRHTRKNARGVDLNRNFPVRWIPQDGKYESGRRPASERETRVMMRFLSEIKPKYVVSFHQPLYGVDMANADKVRPLGRRLSRYLNLPRKRFTCNGGCHGTMTQWFNKMFAGAAITVEYGARMTWRQKNVTGPRGLLRSVGASR